MFKGKVVLFYLINPPEAFVGGIAVSEPVLEERQGRKFVIGSVPLSPNDWTSGLSVGIAYDEIAHFLEFPDEREFLERSEMGGMAHGPIQ